MKREIVRQLDGTWIGTTLKGEVVKSDFFDWCGMEILIKDIMDEQNVDEELAYQKFWNKVREYDALEFDGIVESHGLENGMGNGVFDELRVDYLITIFNIKED